MKKKYKKLIVNLISGDELHTKKQEDIVRFIDDMYFGQLHSIHVDMENGYSVIFKDKIAAYSVYYDEESQAN